MRFTDKGIAALKPKAERYEKWDDGRSGFGVRVSPEGRKSFVFMYRFGGKARRMTIGRYPALSLASARVLFAKAKELLDAGKDPGALALADKRQEREAETVKELVDEYLDRSAKSKRSYAEIKRVLHREVLPAWGSRKAKSIARRDVRVLANGIADRGAPVMANRTLQYINRMFRFGIAGDMLTVNPCTGIERPAVEHERERVLSPEEIKSFWSGLPDTDMTPAVQLILKLLLVTGQRRGEVVGIARDEIDHEAKIWTIPSARTKNMLVHLLPPIGTADHRRSCRDLYQSTLAVSFTNGRRTDQARDRHDCSAQERARAEHQRRDSA
jgi:integrase